MTLGRRSFLSTALAVLATKRAWGAAPPGALGEFDVRDLAVDDDRAKRFTLFLPRHLAKDERVPLLVLLHGLAETVDPRMGVYAWTERYGLETSYARLRHPPIARTSTRGEWTDARLAEVNAMLTAQPLRGLAIACPYTPNIGKPAELEAYARWITEVVIPRARAEGPLFTDAAHTTIDGCSLGGFLSLEVFLRRPEAFAAWGGVQSAIGEAGAAGYAERIKVALAKAGPRALHVETSTNDAFRKGNEGLSRALTERHVHHEFRMLPGPHDQPWLREAGTIEMLLWHDRLMR